MITLLESQLEFYEKAEYCMPLSGGIYKGEYYCPADCKLNWGTSEEDENYCPSPCKLNWDIPFCKIPLNVQLKEN